MITEQRFLFNRDFDPDLLVNGGSHSHGSAKDDKRTRTRAKPVFTEDDLARARAEGFAEGCDKASRDAAQSMERRLTEAFETVGERLGEIIATTEATSAAAARDANAIAVAIARRMVPELYQRNAAAEIEHTVATVLSQVLETNGLTVCTAEALADPLRDRIKALAETRGIGDRVRITADPALSAGDCRIEWQGGGAERMSATLWTEIEAIVQENLGLVPALGDGETDSGNDRGNVNEENTTPMLECAANAPSKEIEVGELMADDENLELQQLDENTEPQPEPATDDVSDAPGSGNRKPQDLEAVYDIPVQVSAVLGKTTMEVNQLLKLGRGAVVELDRKVGEAIDVYVNNRLVARGEVVVVEDRLGVTMTEIIKSDRIQG